MAPKMKPPRDKSRSRAGESDRVRADVKDASLCVLQEYLHCPTPTLLGPGRRDEIRPSTSNGVTESRIRPPFAEFDSQRPRTSERQSPLSATRSRLVFDDSLIGVALGSPYHPPSTFSSMRIPTPTDREGHFFQQEGPLLHQSVKNGPPSWKKFGQLFRRQAASVERGSAAKTELPSPLSKTSSDQIPIVPPKDISLRKASFPTDESTPTVDQQINSQEPSAQSFVTVSSTELRVELPRLDVNIPNVKMDRYSVMFRGLVPADSSGSSNLFSRRAKLQLKPLAAIKTGPAFTHKSSMPDSLARKASSRRSSLPTPAKSPSPFSVLPTTPTLSPNSTLPTLPSTLHIRRRSTISTRLSPMRDTFYAARPPPLRVRKPHNQDVATSADEKTASTDCETSWITSSSVRSSISSATTVDDDILFNVSSFRDSKGLPDRQFEMVPPNPSDVQLYRTMSQMNKAKLAAEQLRAKQLKVALVQNSQEDAIDAAIAVVERLGTPVTSGSVKSASDIEANTAKGSTEHLPWTVIETSKSAPHRARPLVEPQLLAEPTGKQEQSKEEEKDKEVNQIKDQKQTDEEQSKDQKQVDEEEQSKDQKQIEVEKQIEGEKKSKDETQGKDEKHIEAEKQSREVSTDISGFSPALNRLRELIHKQVADLGPPTVPKKDTKDTKDAKFVPISKYALKKSMATVTERTTDFPPVANRSVSDGLQHRPNASVHVAELVVTSANPSAMIDGTSSLLASATIRTAIRSQPHHPLHGFDKPAAPTTVAAVIHPTSNVETARSIAMSRKQSVPLLITRTIHNKPLPNPKLTLTQTLTVPDVAVHTDTEGEKFVDLATRSLIPTLVRGANAHQHGTSMNLCIETT